MSALVGSLLLNLVLNPATFVFYIGPLYMGYPFLDLHCVLAHTEGHMLGWDVRTLPSNPLDFMGRGTPSYPMWWYNGLGFLGLTRQHEIPLALLIIAVFLALALLLMRPSTLMEALIGFLAICSPGVMLCVERANSDLIIFILISVVPLLFEIRSRWGVYLAAVVLFLGVGLKYYPVCGYLIFLHKVKSVKVVCRIYLWTAICLAAYIIYYVEDLALISKSVPAPFNYYTFGGRLFFENIGMEPEIAQTFTNMGFVVIMAVVLLLCAKSNLSLPRLSAWRENFFLLGVLVTAFCFFTLSSYDYRTIFLLFTFPYLMEMAKVGRTHRMYAITAKIFLGMLLLFMWGEGLYWNIIINVMDSVAYRNFTTMLLFTKYSSAWVIMTILVLTAALMLKPDVKRLWADLVEWAFGKSAKEEPVNQAL